MSRTMMITAALLITSLSGLVAIGCARQTAWSEPANGRAVSLGEFADDEHPVRQVELPVDDEPVDRASADADLVDDSVAPPVTIRDPQSSAASSATAADPRRRMQQGDQVVVDSLIGQVNGRPIFADEFFQPIEAQLEAASRRLDQRQFAQEALRVVTTHLEEVVLNELFLAEAEASLSQDERKGIFAFMRYLQEQTISRTGGIEAQARERLALEDLTLEQYLELEKNKALIQKLIYEKIKPRVIVSWRDVEREYQRRSQEFNPPARVTLSRIRLSTKDDTVAIDDVKNRIMNGDAFEDIASDLGFENGGTWRTIQMGGADQEDVALSAEFLQRLGPIEVGRTTEPFEVGDSTWWLHVREVDQPPARSIYDPDVQRMLTNELNALRFSEEFGRYRQKLFQRGIFDELNEMRDRLLAVAMLRYAPSS